jgi:hypothetical protein
MARRKFYKTVITIEVLSEDGHPTDLHSLLDVAAEIDVGDWSGKVNYGRPKRLTIPQMIEACQDQSTDPGFFSIPDKKEK